MFYLVFQNIKAGKVEAASATSPQGGLQLLLKIKPLKSAMIFGLSSLAKPATL